MAVHDETEGESAVPKHPFQRLQFAARLGYLLTGPKEYIESLATFRGWSVPLLDLALLYLIFLFLATLVSSPGTIPLDLFGGIGIVLGGMLTAVIGAIVLLLILGIATLLIHLAVRLLRGTSSFFNTLKMLAASWTVVPVYHLVGMLLLLVLSLFEDHMTYFLFDALALPFRLFPLSKALALLLFFGSLLHSLWLAVVGLSQVHNVSRLRAFFAALVPLLAFILLFALLLLWQLLRWRIFYW